MTSFFELKRQLCPSMRAPEIPGPGPGDQEPAVARKLKCTGARPILVPLKELRLHHVKVDRPWISECCLEKLSSRLLIQLTPSG